MIGLSLLSSVRKHNMWSYYDWVVVVVLSVNIQYGRIMIVFYCYFRSSVNRICGRIMIGSMILNRVD